MMFLEHIHIPFPLGELPQRGAGALALFTHCVLATEAVNPPQPCLPGALAPIDSSSRTPVSSCESSIRHLILHSVPVSLSHLPTMWEKTNTKN